MVSQRRLMFRELKFACVELYTCLRKNKKRDVKNERKKKMIKDSKV